MEAPLPPMVVLMWLQALRCCTATYALWGAFMYSAGQPQFLVAAGAGSLGFMIAQRDLCAFREWRNRRCLSPEVMPFPQLWSAPREAAHPLMPGLLFIIILGPAPMLLAGLVGMVLLDEARELLDEVTADPLHPFRPWRRTAARLGAAP